MLSELSDVIQFEADVSSLLGILDYEYGCGWDAAIQVPPRLTEAYRLELVRSRGMRAMKNLSEWAIGVLSSKLPDESCAQMYAAYKFLQERSEDGAYQALQLAYGATVMQAPYSSLTLTEAAATACLVSALMDIADHLVAGMSADLAIRPNVIGATDELWTLASRGGDLETLVDTLSRFFYLHDYRLGAPKDTSVESIRALMAPDHQNGDLPGFVIALWAAANGHLLTLNDSIASRVAVLNAEYEMRRPFIEAELGLH